MNAAEPAGWAGAELINRGTPVAPVRTGNDGGMHEVFVAALQGGRPVIERDGEVTRLIPVTAPGTIPPTVNPPSNVTFYPAMTPAPMAVASVETEAANVPTPRPAPRAQSRAPTQTAAAEPTSRNFLAACSRPAIRKRRPRRRACLIAPNRRSASAVPMRRRLKWRKQPHLNRPRQNPSHWLLAPTPSRFNRRSRPGWPSPSRSRSSNGLSRPRRSPTPARSGHRASRLSLLPRPRKRQGPLRPAQVFCQARRRSFPPAVSGQAGPRCGKSFFPGLLL